MESDEDGTDRTTICIGQSQGIRGCPVDKAVGVCAEAFNIELDKNLSRTFGDLRIRNRQTPFLDSLKAALLRRMNRPLNNCPGGRNKKTL